MNFSEGNEFTIQRALFCNKESVLIATKDHFVEDPFKYNWIFMLK